MHSSSRRTRKSLLHSPDQGALTKVDKVPVPGLSLWPNLPENQVMIEQLLQIIQQQGQDAVVNNPAVPNEHNNQVMSEAGQSIFNGLQQAMAGGGLSQITSLLGGGDAGSSSNSLASLASNPLVQNIISSFAGKLSGQFNVNADHAQQIGTDLIPQVLSKLGGQVNDPSNTSIDINSVLSSLTGGGAGGAQGGLADMLKGFMK